MQTIINPRKMTNNIVLIWGYVVGFFAGIKLLFIGHVDIDWDAVLKILGTLILSFAGGAAAKGGGVLVEKFMDTKKKAKKLFSKKKKIEEEN